MTKPTRNPKGRPKLPASDKRKPVSVALSSADIERIDALRRLGLPVMPLRQWCYAAIMTFVALAEQRNEERYPKVGLDTADDEDEKVGLTT